MKVCPNCGYVDSPCWRGPMGGGSELEYCRLDDLTEFEPDLARDLQEKGELTDEYYAYRLAPSGYVRRRYKPIWEAMGWDRIPLEKVDHKSKYAKDVNKAEKKRWVKMCVQFCTGR